MVCERIELSEGRFYGIEQVMVSISLSALTVQSRLLCFHLLIRIVIYTLSAKLLQSVIWLRIGVYRCGNSY